MAGGIEMILAANLFFELGYFRGEELDGDAPQLPGNVSRVPGAEHEGGALGLVGGEEEATFGRPQTELICKFGHGTLSIDELQITGRQMPDWQPHDGDIWKELESYYQTRK